MVPGRLLPLAPAELLHQRDRSIPRGRPRAVPRDVRRPGRWDDDCRTPRRRRLVDGDRVIGGVSGHAHERALDRGEQIEGGGRIITPSPRSTCGHGSRLTDRHQGGVSASHVCRGHRVSRPPTHLPQRWTNPCCRARDEGPRRAGPVADGAQMLTAPGERRIVGGGEVEAHHPEQGVQEPFGLAQREMVEEPQSQGGLDGEIRVPPLAAIASEDNHTVTSPRRTRAWL